MLHSGKVCTTDPKRCVLYCGLKPQLKGGVEHDCYIYTWNSACTMEGIDITMVWNSLLIDLCGKLGGLMLLLFAGGLTGENRQGLELRRLH